ncbi:hypothetical protein DFP73DRAFT_560708 [Morchella snyderi]|nr:hypothetical protein DFP73DRAFT_560708 [Morchella snyderi]
MLVNARRDQALPRGLFDAEDNPLTILLEDGRLPTNPDDLKTRFKCYSLSSRKPVTEKTLEEFCMKWKPSNSPCKNYVGACAETWGFQLMLQILSSGDCYYSIALGQGSKGLNSIKLGPGYRYSRSKVNGSKITKGTCSACLYVVCAIKAGFNITMDEITDADITDILDTENSNPVLTTMQAEPPIKGGGLNLLGYFSSKLAR